MGDFLTSPSEILLLDSICMYFRLRMGIHHTWTGLARLFQRNDNFKIHILMSSIQGFIRWKSLFHCNTGVNMKTEHVNGLKNKHDF